MKGPLMSTTIHKCLLLLAGLLLPACIHVHPSGVSLAGDPEADAERSARFLLLDDHESREQEVHGEGALLEEVMKLRAEIAELREQVHQLRSRLARGGGEHGEPVERTRRIVRIEEHDSTSHEFHGGDANRRDERRGDEHRGDVNRGDERRGDEHRGDVNRRDERRGDERRHRENRPQENRPQENRPQENRWQENRHEERDHDRKRDDHDGPERQHADRAVRWHGGDQGGHGREDHGRNFPFQQQYRFFGGTDMRQLPPGRMANRGIDMHSMSWIGPGRQMARHQGMDRLPGGVVMGPTGGMNGLRGLMPTGMPPLPEGEMFFFEDMGRGQDPGHPMMMFHGDGGVFAVAGSTGHSDSCSASGCISDQCEKRKDCCGEDGCCRSAGAIDLGSGHPAHADLQSGHGAKVIIVHKELDQHGDGKVHVGKMFDDGPGMIGGQFIIDSKLKLDGDHTMRGGQGAKK